MDEKKLDENEVNTNQNNKKKISKITEVLVVYIACVIIILLLLLFAIYFIPRSFNKNEDTIQINNFTIPYDPNNNIPHFDQVKKPIIYLYPEEEMSLTVKLGNPEKLTCTYPKYKETGWKVTAYPDGTLVDNETGRSLYSLYWEGLNTENIQFNDGFCVKGEDTIKFLEEKLEILGLNEREAEEFIVYWLPKMEDNKYNLMRFASMEEIEKNMQLNFSVKPDTVIRVLMEYKPVDKYVDIPEQKIETPERTGFTVVEWGGTEVY